MKAQYIPIIVLCEGESEKSYISELSRFLKENESPITLIPKVIGNGHYREVCRAIKNQQKHNPREKFIVWIDFDIYKRESNDANLYSASTKYKSIIKFSRMNFEDFLILHLTQSALLRWEELCINNNHFVNPLHEEEYLPIFRDNMFSNYKKCELPFSIDNKSLFNFVSNYTNLTTKIHCTFAGWIINNIFRKLEIFSSFF